VVCLASAVREVATHFPLPSWSTLLLLLWVVSPLRPGGPGPGAVMLLRI
jgi:hypothetical protein